MRGARRAPLTSLVAVLVVVALAGCGVEGTDDELEPRGTPTVTVTTDAVQELPARLDLASDLGFADEVVWADGTTLHVGGRTTDLAPLVPRAVVVLPTGVLVQTDDRVWFTAGRRAEGLPLPPVDSLAVSADGTQVVLGLTDRTDPVAYDLSGQRVAAGEVGEQRGPGRVRRGPGDAAAPEGVQVRGWLSGTASYGLRGREVVTCAAARCERLGRLDPATDPADVVFGVHPAG